MYITMHWSLTRTAKKNYNSHYEPQKDPLFWNCAPTGVCTLGGAKGGCGVEDAETGALEANWE